MTNVSVARFKIGAVAIVIACGSFLCSAHAGYMITVEQNGPNVVASGSGSIDLTGLSLLFAAVDTSASITPSVATTELASGKADDYSTALRSMPASFGTGGTSFADSSSGPVAGTGTFRHGTLLVIIVPAGYVSGAPLANSTAMYDNTTLRSLHARPGTYEWTWGTGPNQNLTVQIGPPHVPDGGSTLLLLSIALATLTRRARWV
ncbi:MAG: hypothetical protein JO354_03845 [Verrucomicrobia bacterium]|nr:hypothetical protein [Verrucomicrobiota bacterium]